LLKSEFVFRHEENANLPSRFDPEMSRVKSKRDKLDAFKKHSRFYYQQFLLRSCLNGRFDRHGNIKTSEANSLNNKSYRSANQ